jgi:hypothetical protein
MAASAVSISNRAIQILGSTETIATLTENSPNARTMNRVYEPLRLALLRKFRWGFAIQRASLAADASATLFGSLKKYYLPNDYLRVLRDKDAPDYRKDWRIEGDATGPHIVSDESSPLQLRYLADVTDAGRMDALFREALSHYMAHETCQEVTGSTTKKADIKDDLKDIINDAKKAGSIEEDPIEALEDDWILVRL